MAWWRMTWVKLDDGMVEHPKVVGLSDGAFRAHIEALSYVARSLTDGFIPEAAARKSGWTRRAKELVRVGLWEEEDGGHRIHDYLDYNPSRQKVEAKREEARVRMEGVRANNPRSSREPDGKFAESSHYPDPLPDVPTEHLDPPRRRHKPVDEEFIGDLIREFAPVFDERRIRDELERAKNHKSWDSWKDKRRGFRDWLKRSAGWESKRRSPTQTRVTPFEQPERLRAPIIPDSLPVEADASCEPSTVPTNNVIPAFPRTISAPRKP